MLALGTLADDVSGRRGPTNFPTLVRRLLPPPLAVAGWCGRISQPIGAMAAGGPAVGGCGAIGSLGGARLAACGPMSSERSAAPTLKSCCDAAAAVLCSVSQSNGSVAPVACAAAPRARMTGSGNKSLAISRWLSVARGHVSMARGSSGTYGS